MDYLLGFFSNKMLWTSIFACFMAQFLKMFSGEKKFDLTRIITSGGMPSSHSSFVTCLSTMLGVKYGFNSDIFAIAAVFSFIIMYDASGVRQAVGKQATIINKLVEDWHNKKAIEQEKLKELIGHTQKQVFFGAMLGIALGLIFS
ncbi:MAG: divergent PAP2 family protein [Peptostreptococcus sp.]|uniref:Divergent PAP2 family n=1 Tax=Peptostreptococcus anaerobius 653-L TaxID=596329 RepID=D3MRV9_9FIRM|nr:MULTISPECIES: divergent PAP2 family protein [Peptostreptococcus]EFD05112.1 divergent PAP2 family [Peptostreptococcus anaerobius 653-L]MDU3422669.1 divergent PAP2 family protein [Peptostreptococcus anaerobius]MDU3429553.1 divergent PAP2 family protein [Peptostreptococcus sp.]MDU3454754.1 divergent PAP2 family protein [Peptostreptococcus sp.]MDU5680888.1 divergent PAP2 family protein [Peptostreptococcus sp.]